MTVLSIYCTAMLPGETGNIVTIQQLNFLKSLKNL
jgi:hypothetical protein